MDNSPKNDFPWELIAESLTGNINAGEGLQLQQWISSDPENEKKYLQIQELWKNGLEDYRFYRMANETEAWDSLHTKLGKDHSEQKQAKVIQGQFVKSRKYIRNLVAIAAVFIGFMGLIWLVITWNKPVIYQTALNEQKKVTLIDGTLITLHQGARIEVPHNYNKIGRTLTMASGEADFEVVHGTDKPFIVELGTSRIKDIGTSFIIQMEDRLIHVAVSTGKIAFVRIATQETRELTAGSAITFDVQQESFGTIEKTESSKAFEQWLIFENTPLSEVIASFQKVYGRQVIINDSIAGKKITAKLNGMNFSTAIQVICKSLGLEYSINDSIYALRAKNSEQP
jgi:transmembrane sensor